MNVAIELRESFDFPCSHWGQGNLPFAKHLLLIEDHDDTNVGDLRRNQ